MNNDNQFTTSVMKPDWSNIAREHESVSCADHGCTQLGVRTPRHKLLLSKNSIAYVAEKQLHTTGKMFYGLLKAGFRS